MALLDYDLHATLGKLRLLLPLGYKFPLSALIYIES